MTEGLYVLVLDGARPRKLHAPDCEWVARKAQEAPTRPEYNWRRYELRPAGEVTGQACLRCGGIPGPANGLWPVRH